MQSEPMNSHPANFERGRRDELFVEIGSRPANFKHRALNADIYHEQIIKYY